MPVINIVKFPTTLMHAWPFPIAISNSSGKIAPASTDPTSNFCLLNRKDRRTSTTILASYPSTRTRTRTHMGGRESRRAMSDSPACRARARPFDRDRHSSVRPSVLSRPSCDCSSSVAAAAVKADRRTEATTMTALLGEQREETGPTLPPSFPLGALPSCGPRPHITLTHAGYSAHAAVPFLALSSSPLPLPLSRCRCEDG